MSPSTDSSTDFEQLVAEALQQEFSGWDFAFINDRWQMQPTSWDYRRQVCAYLGAATALLDMGTGGGEFLAELAPLPPDTWATEAYPPNFPIAQARLAPLGVQVVEPLPNDGLPFPDARFDLVINRHESFSAAEVYRVLKPGGHFITQQVGGRDNQRLNELLQAEVEFEYADWALAQAVSPLRDAGFHILEQREEFPETHVTDIGAVVFYLRAIPWQISDFSVAQYRERLRALHAQIQAHGGLTLHSHSFYIAARKAGA